MTLKERLGGSSRRDEIVMSLLELQSDSYKIPPTAIIPNDITPNTGERDIALYKRVVEYLQKRAEPPPILRQITG